MHKQSGYLMLIIAILLVVIAGLATSFVSMMSSSSNSSISTISANNAYYLSSSGLEDGLYQLSLSSANCSSSWSSIVTITGQGGYQYNCTQYSATNTISAALSAVATTIPLNSVTGFATFGSITIGSETIYYDGISGNSLKNALRGQNGTTAATHSLGATVTQSQYIIGSQGGAPSLSAPYGSVKLYQAVQTQSNVYFAAGNDSSSNGAIMAYNGTTWSSALASNPSSFTFFGISTSSTYGQAVGYGGSTSSIYVYNGSTWSSLSTIGNFLFSDVSCDVPNNPTNCWVVGQTRSSFSPSNRALTYHAGTSYYYPSGASYMLAAVSCNSGNCAAVGQGSAYNFSSTTSVNPIPITLSNQFNDVACTAAGTCLAVQNNGFIYYYNGSSWGSFITLNPNQNLNGVACPTSSTCFVVGNKGVTFNCSLPITGPSSCVSQGTVGNNVLLTAVNCISTSNCLAVTSATGTSAYTYNGSTWTAIVLPAKYSFNSVSNAQGSGVVLTIFHNQ
jgi:hypothetical protein